MPLSELVTGVVVASSVSGVVSDVASVITSDVVTPSSFSVSVVVMLFVVSGVPAQAARQPVSTPRTTDTINIFFIVLIPFYRISKIASLNWNVNSERHYI